MPAAIVTQGSTQSLGLDQGATMKKIQALRHLAFEDLGQREPLLTRRSIEIRYVEVGVAAPASERAVAG